MNKMDLRPALWALLLFALTVRIHGVFVAKQGLSYDESISYLCSGTSQARFAELYEHRPEVILTAGDIQALYARPSLDYGTLARDMSTLDRHPPLYFWALHTVHHFLGFHLWDGLLLNLLIGLLMLAVLYRLARRLGLPMEMALLVLAVYYLSPTVLQLDLESRQYALLGLITLISAMLGERLASGPRPWYTHAAFILVNTGGFLTHYYYGFLLLPGIGLCLLRNGLGRRSILYVGGLVAALCLFLLLYPGIFAFIHVYAHEASQAYRSPFTKLRVVLYYGCSWFFAEFHPLRYAALFVLAIATTITLLRADLRQRLLGLVRSRSAWNWYFLVMLWNIAFTLLMYAVDVAPSQAVGEQYFSYIWPFAALFVVVWGKALLPVRWRTWVAGTYLVALAIQLPFALQRSPYLQTMLPPSWASIINTGQELITTIYDRSDLPRNMIGLDSTLPVQLTHRAQPPSEPMITRVAVLARDNRPFDAEAWIEWHLSGTWTYNGRILRMYERPH
ncbi:MAG: glycosyltransferase family 39 protein [Flavobacteriales bacterium]